LDETAKEDGNMGTDHGHGNVMFVMGGGMRGAVARSTVNGPASSKSNCSNAAILQVTTDYRSVLGEVVSGHLGRNPDEVFPGFKMQERLGLLKS
jgi:uncharacterized protein (DUF1501 family)